MRAGGPTGENTAEDGDDTVNKRQRRVTYAGIVLLILFSTFPYYEHRNAFNFIFTNGVTQIHWSITGLVLGAIVVLTAGAVILTSGQRGRPGDDNDASA